MYRHKRATKQGVLVCRLIYDDTNPTPPTNTQPPDTMLSFPSVVEWTAFRVWTCLLFGSLVYAGVRQKHGNN